jgi:hypothetical protein
MKGHPHPSDKRMIHGQIVIIKCYLMGIIGGSPDASGDDFSGTQK